MTASRAGWVAALPKMWRRTLLGGDCANFGLLGSRVPNLHDIVDVQ